MKRAYLNITIIESVCKINERQSKCCADTNTTMASLLAQIRDIFQTILLSLLRGVSELERPSLANDTLIKIMKT